MHYLGIDLAWGQRSRTGVAVLGPTGRLLASTSVVTDDEIADVLRAVDLRHGRRSAAPLRGPASSRPLTPRWWSPTSPAAVHARPR